MEKPTKNNLPKRKPLRLRDFDYSEAGVYFITVCTKERRNILSRIISVEIDGLGASQSVDLLPCGRIAEKYINQINEFYTDIEVDGYVIMPNHIHLLLRVLDQDDGYGPSRTSAPTRQHSTVARVVSTFKRFSNKECGENIWQRRFYDHVIRSQKDYEEHLRYIEGNPFRWQPS